MTGVTPLVADTHHLALVVRHADACQQAAILQQQDIADALAVVFEQRYQRVVRRWPGLTEGSTLLFVGARVIGCLQGCQPGVQQVPGGGRLWLFKIVPALRTALRDVVVDGLGIGNDCLLPLLLGVLLVHERIGLLVARAFHTKRAWYSFCQPFCCEAPA